MEDSRADVPTYDVIVVGGGPAGSTAAYFLGEAGKRVLILEKESMPRYKTCGGGLSLRFLREQFPFSFDSIRTNEAASVSYIYANQETTIPLSRGAIGMVMRAELDAYLLRQTRAEVIQQAAVRTVRELDDRVLVETRDGRCFSSGYLIGADGANSAVARSLGLRPRRTLVAAMEAEVAVPLEIRRRFEGRMVFIFDEIHYGYLWIFSKGEHLSVGIGALRPRPGELQKTLKRVMSRYGIQIEDQNLHGHPIPIYTRRERVSTSRALLVGDAAGMADPLSGEGIRFAIKTGRLAAESLLKGRPERYPRELARTVGADHFFAMLISVTFYFCQDLLLFLGTPNPFSTQAIVDMLGDHMSTAGFFFYSGLTLPIFIATELVSRTFRRLGYAPLSDRIRAWVYPQEVNASYHTGGFAGQF